MDLTSYPHRCVCVFLWGWFQEDGSSFEEGMLKLLRTLPKVLKFLPSDKAKDARSFMMSFQYWLGGSPDNLESMLLMLAKDFVKVHPCTQHDARPLRGGVCRWRPVSHHNSMLFL